MAEVRGQKAEDRGRMTENFEFGMRKWELTLQRAESIELEISSDFSRKIGDAGILIIRYHNFSRASESLAMLEKSTVL